ncbi:TPA: hypothetical protein RQJ37_003484 [Vibrio vulnificus]|nr:hypothetical protein [Vibrio vulnificus]HDY7900635.1 hypothetical protein [Vibrio vulnificus]HDY7941709.1 hypothetical protein [Vibrio vulnificus]
MIDMKAIVRNPKTGLWEYKQYEEYRPKGQITTGVDKMRSHFDAASSLEQQQLALIAKEQERLAAQKAQGDAIRTKRLQEQEERAAVQMRADRELQDKQRKQESDALAQAMKENREKHMGNKARQ